MPSTVIRSFAYRPERRELLIEFTTGRRYLYLGVQEETAAALRSARAKGPFFNRHIRGAFPYREVEGAAQS